jgi:hypothetical protein
MAGKAAGRLPGSVGVALVGTAAAFKAGAMFFLLADALEAVEWGGLFNGPGADEFDFAGSDEDRAAAAARVRAVEDGIDADSLSAYSEVEFGDRRRGLVACVGMTAWLAVFRTAAGLLLVDSLHDDDDCIEVVSESGESVELPRSPQWWSYITSPLRRTFPAGAVHAPSGWLWILSAVDSPPDLGLDRPQKVHSLIKRADERAIWMSGSAGGHALLVQTGATALTVHVEPEREHPFGRVGRCEIRDEHWADAGA